MKKSFLVVLMTCLLVGSTTKGQTWVRFTSSTPEAPVTILSGSDDQSVNFTVEVCGMYEQTITEGVETFQRVSVPSSGTLTATGEPELPAIRQLIAIPECTGVSLNVTITGQLALSNYHIYPVPDYQEAQDAEGGTYVEEVFSKDAAAYATNAYLPGVNAEIVSTGYLRDQKYAEVLIYPLQFNPVTGQLTVYTNYEITLGFTNPSTAVNVNTGIFNNVATNTMLNYVSGGITASINDNVQGNGNVQWITLTDPAQADDITADYLVICAEPFFEPGNPESEVLRIANHRASYNGFDVAILNASNVISDDLGFFYEGQNNVPPNLTYKKEQRIRTCIRRIYEGANAQHTYDGKLGYVLLIGDSEYQTNLGMPTSNDPEPGAVNPYGELFPSDYYYTCLTKENEMYDDVGDVYIGRFCVDNNLQTGLTELHNIIEKTIFFESEYSFGNWRNNIVHTNGSTGSSNYYNIYYDYVDELYGESYNLNVANWYELGGQIREPTIEMINNGSIFMQYYGHGAGQTE